MQFYLNGFYPGDPELEPAPRGQQPHQGVLPDEVDVLIVGSGPAGLVLAAQLAQFPAIRTRIVEARSGPLQLGQADGVACRTVEMFEAFGISERLLREAYWVNETVFWGPGADDPSRIVRSERIQDVEDDLSEFPHVIVNQARAQEFLLEVMRKSPTRLEPDYGVEFVDLAVGAGEHPVQVTLRHSATGGQMAIRANYVVGCDGARSAVRRSMGLTLRGDATNQAWGVMDVLAVTDFPDYRLKAVIRDGAGNGMLLIPREGGYLARLYVELGETERGQSSDGHDVSREDIVAAAQRILQPYRLDVKETAWWSVYKVGQRLCDRFDDVPQGGTEGQLPRVFIAGDACHTHSAKAGQGMNVSMQDGFNLGWKLASVLEERSHPTLLHTYSSERQAVAQELIDFDREWVRVLDDDPERFQQLFIKQGRYTAGVAIRYSESMIRGTDDHQHLATGLPIGMRFHSAPVIRLADARPVELGHAARADGRWRLYLFSDPAHPADPNSRLARCCKQLCAGANSPIRRHTPPNADIDSVLDVRAVLQQGHRDLSLDQVPALLRPTKGRLGLVDYEKVFCANPRINDAFDLRGIDRTTGCMVLVRPDQYVAHVLPLDETEQLGTFLAGVLGLPGSGCLNGR